MTSNPVMIAQYHILSKIQIIQLDFLRKLLALLASTIQMPKLKNELKREKIHSHFHDDGCILILQTYLYSNNNISILSEIQVILVVSSNINSNAILIHTDFHTRYAIGLYSFPSSRPN